MADEVKTAAPKAVEAKFPRDALAASKKYANWRDTVMIALEAEKEYTIAEADAAVKNFLGTEIKEKINRRDD